MDVIVVDGSATARAAKTATSTIPVVFALATDPVAEGLVSSMARPGNNLTGLDMSVGYQLAGKRVELLKDVKPNLARLAMLAQPDNTTARAYLQDTEIVSRALGIDTRTFEVRTADDLPRAFAAQPSKLELVVNLKTAQALGLTISRDFLLRADEVIE